MNNNSNVSIILNDGDIGGVLSNYYETENEPFSFVACFKTYKKN